MTNTKIFIAIVYFFIFLHKGSTLHDIPRYVQNHTYVEDIYINNIKQVHRKMVKQDLPFIYRHDEEFLEQIIENIISNAHKANLMLTDRYSFNIDYQSNRTNIANRKIFSYYIQSWSKNFLAMLSVIHDKVDNRAYATVFLKMHNKLSDVHKQYTNDSLCIERFSGYSLDYLNNISMLRLSYIASMNNQHNDFCNSYILDIVQYIYTNATDRLIEVLEAANCVWELYWFNFESVLQEFMLCIKLIQKQQSSDFIKFLHQIIYNICTYQNYSYKAQYDYINKDRYIVNAEKYAAIGALVDQCYLKNDNNLKNAYQFYLQYLKGHKEQDEFLAEIYPKLMCTIEIINHNRVFAIYLQELGKFLSYEDCQKYKIIAEQYSNYSTVVQIEWYIKNNLWKENKT